MDNPLMIYYAHRPLQFYKHTDLNVFIAHRSQCLYKAHGSHRSHGSAHASHGSRLVLNLGHSPLYRHFCKCLYIELLKISLVY